jgi:hypothetical protein
VLDFSFKIKITAFYFIKVVLVQHFHLPLESAKHKAPAAIPKLAFHHTFALRRIAVAAALVLLLTILTTLCWVLFGVPGKRARSGDARWREDAERRVGRCSATPVAAL